jgi:hypothetical protein
MPSVGCNGGWHLAGGGTHQADFGMILTRYVRACLEEPTNLGWQDHHRSAEVSLIGRQAEGLSIGFESALANVLIRRRLFDANKNQSGGDEFWRDGAVRTFFHDV